MKIENKAITTEDTEAIQKVKDEDSIIKEEKKEKAKNRGSSTMMGGSFYGSSFKF